MWNAHDDRSSTISVYCPNLTYAGRSIENSGLSVLSSIDAWMTPRRRPRAFEGGAAELAEAIDGVD
jgi:hypothetical protein